MPPRVRASLLHQQFFALLSFRMLDRLLTKHAYVALDTCVFVVTKFDNPPLLLRILTSSLVHAYACRESQRNKYMEEADKPQHNIIIYIMET